MLIAHYSVFTPYMYFSNKWYIFIFHLSSSGKQITFWILFLNQKRSFDLHECEGGWESCNFPNPIFFFYSKFPCFPKKFTPLMPDSYILFLQCQIKLNSSWHLMSELAAAFLPHVWLVLSHYQTDNVLSMLKFGLIKKKGRYLAILISVLPGRKRQWFDNHIVDMPDVICSENFFKVAQ